MRLKPVQSGVALVAAGGALVAGTIAIAKNPPMMMAHTGAKLKVLAPKNGTTLTANALGTLVSITHFKVDCRYAGTANHKGIGHYHIHLDGELVNMFCAPRASVSMQNVAPGRHTFEVNPAANDHADDMMAGKTVRFLYRPVHALPTIRPVHFAGKPSIRILSPRNGATVHGGFDLVVQVKNLRLSCSLFGKQPISGWGHWHANVDTTTAGMMGMGTMLGMSCGRSFHVSLAGIKPGTHRFFAILQNNLHIPAFGVQAALTVNVR